MSDEPVTDPLAGRTADRALDAVVREEAASLVASLARWCGDLAVAEESVADAIEAAVVAWRRDGVPGRPGAWLHTAARRRALDRLRRARRHADKVALLERCPSEPRPHSHGDERLPLLFACCHPAIGVDAQLALTLRAVIGLTTHQIARAFVVPEATVAQRISRAKRKVVDAHIPLVVPPREELASRLDLVLTVLCLTYNEGHLTTSGAVGHRRDLAEDAIWLARLLDRMLPGEPEVQGLLALLLLSHARDGGRWDDQGGLVSLAEQDRSRWDLDLVREGIDLVERAGRARRPGRFQLQAAIAAVHDEAPSYELTDWSQIVVLYDLLRRHDDSPIVRLNRAVALAHVAGARPALEDVEALAGPLDGYHLFHAVRAHLLRQLDRHAEARAADERALAMTTNVAERAVIAARVHAAPA